MNPLQSTMLPGTLVYIHFTLLPYGSDQICPPHWIYISLNCYYSLDINPTVVHTYLKTQENATVVYHAIVIYVPPTNMPLNLLLFTLLNQEG